MADERMRILTKELSGLPLFEGLADEEIRVLLEGSRVSRYGKDTPLIFEEGEPASELCILLRGEVEVIKHDTTGAEYLMTTLPAGQFLGERSLLKDEERSATVRARNEVLILHLGRPEYEKLLASHPQAVNKLLLRMLSETSDRLRLLNEHYVLTKGCLDRLKSF